VIGGTDGEQVGQAAFSTAQTGFRGGLPVSVTSSDVSNGSILTTVCTYLAVFKAIFVNVLNLLVTCTILK
jgi:hypothetical protein